VPLENTDTPSGRAVQFDMEAAEIEDITYERSADALRARDLDKHLVNGTIRQVPPFPENPWGVFFLEFRNPELFTSNRGMTGSISPIIRSSRR
jgi:hypothetical protein